jgi:hypothetical protein
LCSYFFILLFNCGQTARFAISQETNHGEELMCSHRICSNSGIKFFYCAHCDKPVYKRDFARRHSHKDEEKKAKAKSAAKSIKWCSKTSASDPASAARLNRQESCTDVSYNGEERPNNVVSGSSIDTSAKVSVSNHRQSGKSKATPSVATEAATAETAASSSGESESNNPDQPSSPVSSLSYGVPKRTDGDQAKAQVSFKSREVSFRNVARDAASAVQRKRPFEAMSAMSSCTSGSAKEGPHIQGQQKKADLTMKKRGPSKGGALAAGAVKSESFSSCTNSAPNTKSSATSSTAAVCAPTLEAECLEGERRRKKIWDQVLEERPPALDPSAMQQWLVRVLVVSDPDGDGNFPSSIM